MVIQVSFVVETFSHSVFKRKSQNLIPGECWAFVGAHGFLTIKLSQRINVSAVSYEHLPRELAVGEDWQSTPKEFIVWVSFLNLFSKLE